MSRAACSPAGRSRAVSRRGSGRLQIVLRSLQGPRACPQPPATAGARTALAVACPCPAQVREDVTRYRYGDEQHLDEALTRIFR